MSKKSKGTKAYRGLLGHKDKYTEQVAVSAAIHPINNGLSRYKSEYVAVERTPKRKKP